MTDRIAVFLNRVFEDWKLVRRLTIFWAAFTAGWATDRMFSDVSAITGPAAAAYATAVGVLGTVIAFYQWSRGRDEP